MAKATKPAKPYPLFPLHAHGSGQWACKIGGKHHYFGAWRVDGGGWREALAKYNAEVDDLRAQRLPESRRADGVAEVINRYLDHQLRRAEAGEMTMLAWQGQRRSLAAVVAVLGRTRPLASLTHEDWSMVRAEIATGKRLETVKHRLSAIKTWLNWCHETGVLTHKVSSPALKAPKAAAIRRQRHERGALAFTRDEIRALLGAADATMQAAILLGANCGLAASDLDHLRWRHVDRSGPWLNLHRPKTGVMRRARLWARTVKALDAAAKGTGRDDLILRGPRGGNLSIDAASGKGFSYTSRKIRQLCKELGIHQNRRSFHGLRRAFSTTAHQTGDAIAVESVMGHVVAGDEVASVYRASIDDARLVKIAAHVEKWLFGRKASNRKAR